ncbi:hypothetical protein G8O29_17820 [Rhodobacter sp. M37P]|uniref:NADP-dependent oxidoreductase domain-containing protein n=1 Tax=Rhodobacter calidifons TaxID=2715277 RepID=A0ABX0GCR9_9RHOB|nr:hypothetical protein [Rhodobacter calidifons]
MQTSPSWTRTGKVFRLTQAGARFASPVNDLRAEGKIDRIGVSLRDNHPEEGVTLARLGLVASQQVIFNMFEQHPRDALLPAATEGGTAIIARVPLDSGSLVGTWTEDSYAGFEPGSQPHRMFRGDRFAQTLARVRRLGAEVAPFYPTLGCRPCGPLRRCRRGC